MVNSVPVVLFDYWVFLCGMVLVLCEGGDSLDG